MVGSKFEHAGYCNSGCSLARLARSYKVSRVGMCTASSCSKPGKIHNGYGYWRHKYILKDSFRNVHDLGVHMFYLQHSLVFYCY